MAEDKVRKSQASYDDLISSLPKSDRLLHYKGFWLSPQPSLKGLLMIQDHHLIPKPDDIFLASYPKSGTTWLKALLFATMHRSSYDLSTHPLLSSNPHDLVPFLEKYVCHDPSVVNNLPPPRLLATHLPFTLLPEFVTSNARFVYIFRDPKDVVVSLWHFRQSLISEEHPPVAFKDEFEGFCDGISAYGPYWDQVLNYWKASLEAPEKILWLKYEDMKREPKVHVKRLAEFMGKPFSMSEENEGGVDEIIRLCSFERLRNLEVNKNSSTVRKFTHSVKNSYFFRKGEVGDWKNYLTSEMAARMDEITRKKFHDSGLTLD